MDHSTTINIYRRRGLQVVAWVCLTLCVAIIGFAGSVAYLTSSRTFAALDPLPVLRWDDVR